MAKVVRFYGLDPDRVLNLDIFTFKELWQSITVLEAQDFLVQAKLHLLSKMTKEARTKIMRDMHRQAFPKQFNPKNATLTAQELAAKMAKRGKDGG